MANQGLASELTKKRCVPCEGGVPPLDARAVERHAAAVPSWSVTDGKLSRRVGRKTFREVIDLIDAIADLAEDEGHHPDMAVHYSVLDLTVWTHALGEGGGLSENDFILAVKIDRLLDAAGTR